MSKMGWRWFGVAKSGAVQSFFSGRDVPWPTDEARRAECDRGAWLRPSQYSHDQHEPQVRINKALSAKDSAERDAILKNVVPFESCPECQGDGHEHQVAELDCSCGIYVFKWSEDALALPYVQGYRANCQVFGVVEWWGHYTEHEIGYRVEFAQLRAIHAWGKGTKVHPAYQIDRVQDLDQLIERYEPDYDKEGNDDA